MIVFVLVGIAYLTMLERKVLRYNQFRKEPNKVDFLGLLQPFSDGLKLLFVDGMSDRLLLLPDKISE